MMLITEMNLHFLFVYLLKEFKSYVNSFNAVFNYLSIFSAQTKTETSTFTINMQVEEMKFDHHYFSISTASRDLYGR